MRLLHQAVLLGVEVVGLVVVPRGLSAAFLGGSDQHEHEVAIPLLKLPSVRLILLQRVARPLHLQRL